MTAAKIQPPLISLKNEKNTKILLLQSRMRSLQYIVIILCAIILFGSVLYFAVKENKHQEKQKVKEEGQNLPGGKEPLIKEESQPKIEKPSDVEKLVDKENVIHSDEKDTSKTKEENKQQKIKPAVEIVSEKEESKENTKLEQEKESSDTIKYTEKEGEITKCAGSIFLKTGFGNMICIMGEVSPVSVSCCGTLSLSKDGPDPHACLLLDTYEVTGSNENTYRMRLTVEKELAIYEEVIGFPKPAKKCYPLSEKYNKKEICTSINFVSLDPNVSDETGYKTCTIMNFGYGPEKSNKTINESQLLGHAENVKCDIDKETVVKKVLGTPLALVIRLLFNSETTDDTKVNKNSDVKEMKIEDGDKLMLLQYQSKENHNLEQQIIHSTTDQSEIHQTEPLPILKEETSQLTTGKSTVQSEIPSDTNHENSTQSPSPDANVTSANDKGGFSRVLHEIIDFIQNHVLSLFKRI